MHKLYITCKSYVHYIYLYIIIIVLPCPLPAFYILFPNKQINTQQNMKHNFDELRRSLRFQHVS